MNVTVVTQHPILKSKGRFNFPVVSAVLLCTCLLSSLGHILLGQEDADREWPTGIQVTVFEDAPDVSLISWSYFRSEVAVDGTTRTDLHSVRFLSSMRWDASQFPEPGWLESGDGSFSTRVSVEVASLAVCLSYHQLDRSIISGFQAETDRRPGEHLILAEPFTRADRTLGEFTREDAAFAAALYEHYQSSDLYYRPEVIEKRQPRKTPLEYKILSDAELEAIRETTRQIMEAERLAPDEEPALERESTPAIRLETAN